MSVMDNFFEDESLESNSDDSGNDDEDEDDEAMDGTDEIYKRYFGGASWKGISDIRTSIGPSQSDNAPRSVHHRVVGPSSDMLQPVVTVNVVVQEDQNILLAKGWKLGRFECGDDHGNADPDKSDKSVRQDLARTPKKDTSSLSRTMSVPELSRVSGVNKTMGPPLRENMEESVTFLNKLFSHQQESDLNFPTTLLSPPDSRMCKLKIRSRCCISLIYLIILFIVSQ